MAAKKSQTIDLSVFERAVSTKEEADKAYVKWRKMVTDVEAAWGHVTPQNNLDRAKLLWATYGPTIKRLAVGVAAGSSASGGLVAWLGEPGTLGNIVGKLFGVG